MHAAAQRAHAGRQKSQFALWSHLSQSGNDQILCLIKFQTDQLPRTAHRSNASPSLSLVAPAVLCRGPSRRRRASLLPDAVLSWPIVRPADGFPRIPGRHSIAQLLAPPRLTEAPRQEAQSGMRPRPPAHKTAAPATVPLPTLHNTITSLMHQLRESNYAD